MSTAESIDFNPNHSVQLWSTSDLMKVKHVSLELYE